MVAVAAVAISTKGKDPLIDTLSQLQMCMHRVFLVSITIDTGKEQLSSKERIFVDNQSQPASWTIFYHYKNVRFYVRANLDVLLKRTISDIMDNKFDSPQSTFFSLQYLGGAYETRSILH